MLETLKEKFSHLGSGEELENMVFPPACDVVFDRRIKHPDVYIWDAWTYSNGHEINLYTLASPRAFYERGGADLITQRDHLPHHWRRFHSQDAGETWRDRGPVFRPRLGTNLFDSRSIWTGSVLKHDGRYLSGYTGVREIGDAQPKMQALGLAVSDDCQTFKPLSEDAFSCPMRDYDAIKNQGYYLGPFDTLGNADGEEGGAILAWRDPCLAADEDNRVHAFWGAKSSARKFQEAVLGHGVIDDPFGARRFTLLDPVFMPDAEDFTEAEVPQVLWNKQDGNYVLMLSTTNKRQGMNLEDVAHNVRLYRSQSLNGPWQAVLKKDIGSDKRYPGVFCGLRTENSRTHVVFNAPFASHALDEIKHTMPPLEYLPLPSL